jgi:hypothetical protein
MAREEKSMYQKVGGTSKSCCGELMVLTCDRDICR